MNSHEPLTPDFLQMQSLLKGKEEELARLNRKLQENVALLSRTEFMLNKSQQITKTGSWEIDLTTGKFSCSNEFYAIHGIDRNFDLSDQSFFVQILYGTQNSTRILSGLEELKRAGTPLDITFQYTTGIGCKRWFRLIAYPFYSKETMTEITGVVHDITSFKETEERLSASEEKFYTLFKFTPDFMSLARESDGVIVEVNDKAIALTGYSQEEMKGKKASDLHLWEDPKELDDFFNDYSKSNRATAEVSWRKKDGERLHVMISSVRVVIAGEYYRLSLVKDITSRKKAEEKFNAAFNLNPDLMTILREEDAAIEEINENVMDMLGYTRQEVIGKTSLDLNLWVNQEDRARFYEQYKTSNKVSFEAKWRKKNGQEIYVLLSAARIQLYNERFTLTSVKDVTARMQAEKMFQTVFRSSPDMMAIVRKKDLIIIDVNDKVYNATGFQPEEFIGQHTDKLNIWFSPEDRVQAHADTTGDVSVYEARLRRKDGKEVFVLISSSLIEVSGEPHFLYITKDITDRKRTQDKLRYSEANLAATINNTQMMIWSLDTNYYLIAQNDATRQFAEKYFGKSIEVGQPIFVPDNAKAPAAIAFWDGHYKKVFQGEHVHCFHTEFGHQFEISINPIRDNGKVVGLTVFSMDITDRIARELEVVTNLERLAEAEKRIGELKLMSLRSAMNPHFIFNALNSIQFFISKNEREQAIQYLSTFSKLIRGILVGSAQKRIRLAEELDLLKHYTDLEKVRFENKFDVKFTIDSKVDKENIEVPSLLIQPFVENAILHGLSNRGSGGILKISIRQQSADRVLFEVEDNGIGRDAAKKLRDLHQKNHKSLGISLAEERLKMINSDSHASIETDDLYSAEKPCGTRVKIWLKIR
jgi:PAS domain S-box-containing protein